MTRCRHGFARATLALLLASTSACSRDAMTDQPFADPRMAPLAQAVAGDDAAAVEREARQVHPDTPGDDGTTLLQWAVHGGRLAAAEALIAAGADPNRVSPKGGSPMHAAAFNDEPALLKLLLAHGGDPSLRNPATGETPLVRAVLGRGTEQVRLLLAAGADPDAADANGGTPLQRAGGINAGDLVLLLLEAGANAEHRNARGDTFQPYYFQHDEARLNTRAKAERAAVAAWLRAHKVPLERDAG